jgi:hypothetical protein
MATAFVGVLNSVSQQITIERTDGTPDGPDTITLDDGAYFALDLGTQRATGSGTGTTVPFGSGHPFVVGQTVSARDTSDTLAWGPVTILSITGTSITVDASVSYGINDETYVSDDLVGYVNARVHNTATVPNYFGLTLSLSEGKLTWTADATETYTVTWPTAVLQTWTRFDDTVLVTDSGISADRQMQGYLYLAIEAQRDPLTKNPRASQSESVTGVLETLYRAAVRRRIISIRTTGPPRSSLKTSYQAAEDFWDSHLAQGLRYRYYVDASNTQPYVLFTNPRGYETMVHLGPAEFRMAQLQRGNDNTLDMRIESQEYVAA